ncbi:MAG: formyltransferase family protein [Sedimenticola sp.]
MSNNRTLRIFFIGSVALSEKLLEKLVASGADIVGVATREQSTFNADFADLRLLAEKNDIPTIYTIDINAPSTLKRIQATNPDIIFCFGWSQLIKAPLLELAPMGVVGFHPSLLPENRGRHPIIWALALGLETTGATFFFMDEGADSGPIFSQERIAISCEDEAASLYSKVEESALRQLVTFLPRLAERTHTQQPQNHALSNVWRKRGKEDGCIDFHATSLSIRNLVRALTRPYIGAHVMFLDQEIKVWRAEKAPYELSNIEPGKVLSVECRTITVKTSDGAIRLVEHEFDPLPITGMYL